MWLAYLESQGLLKPDDPEAMAALFGAFPVRQLPRKPGQDEQPAKTPEQMTKNPFSCDDPTAG